MEYRSIRRLLFIVSLLLIVLVFILISCGVLFTRKVFNENSSSHHLTQKYEDEIETYRFIETNLEGDQILNTGFITYPKPDKPEEETSIFTVFEDESKLSLISDFGSTEYKCTGNCYCEKNNIDGGEYKRRSSAASKIFSNGLIYLVASVSSLVAYNKAKEYFHDHCQLSSNFEHYDCSNGNVRSEIDDCSPLKSEENLLDKLLFECHGYCVRSSLNVEFEKLGEKNNYDKNLLAHLKRDHLKKITNIFQTSSGRGRNCEKMELKGTVTGKTAQLYQIWKNAFGRDSPPPHTEEEIDKLMDQLHLESARLHFIGINLDRFCSENSVMEFLGSDLNGVEMKFGVGKCSGYSQRKIEPMEHKSKEYNDSVQCVRIYK